MDQDTAKKLFNKGGFFILLGVPEGTEFGIDLKSWNTGEKFRGVKMIPPGLHYIFYSAVNNGDTAPRAGLFYYFHSAQVIVKKWNALNECISTDVVSNEEIVGLKDNIKALDNFLGLYPYDIWERWKQLSSHISDNLVKKLIPLNGEVRSALELEGCSNEERKNAHTNDESSTSKRLSRPSYNEFEDDILPELKPKEGTNLRFSVFPVKSYPDGSSPSDITKHSLDSTYLFEQLISSYDVETDILGEMEFCYICFLVGHSFEAFEQWKKIYDNFLSIIELQVKEIPEEFLADIVSNNNFVYVKLRNLFRFIKGCEVDDKLKSKADRLRKNLSDLYQWDFSHLESDDEDDAPVVVEL
ncbi:hypothetical protein GWI33_016196 [Rhynchophorus ferrugineus]|uniref:Protein AAR2 homolog n=1 Tax=Rhynchophorus ferrugineus TaxID=354439 RepID=A0A834I185_RHYFE|nr:hypothetical protein GWI33_016196 [Rhynchophorus ferrugineus]